MKLRALPLSSGARVVLSSRCRAHVRVFYFNSKSRFRHYIMLTTHGVKNHTALDRKFPDLFVCIVARPRADATPKVLTPKPTQPTHHPPPAERGGGLVHAADQRVDLVLAVACLTALDVVQALLGHAAERGGELEGPQEVGARRKVRPHGVDLVDEVLDADDALLAQRLLDDGVVGERDALLVDLAVPALVDELLHRLQVRVPEHHVGLHLLEHVHRRLVDAQEDAVVDLAQAHKLQDLASLGVQVVKATQAHHEHQLRLGLHVESALRARLALQPHKVSLLRGGRGVGGGERGGERERGCRV